MVKKLSANALFGSFVVTSQVVNAAGNWVFTMKEHAIDPVRRAHGDLGSVKLTMVNYEI